MDIHTYEFLKRRMYTLIIIILLILGWVLIIGGCFWLSRSMSFQYYGSMLPIYDIIEPYYSFSLLLAAGGLVVLGAMHVFIFLKFKNKISLVSTFFMILGAYMISIRALDRLSIIEYEEISGPFYVYPYFFSLIFGFGFAGITYLSLKKWEPILLFAGILTVLIGLPLSFILVMSMPVDICTMILVFAFIFPLVGFYLIYKKERNIPLFELERLRGFEP